MSAFPVAGRFVSQIFPQRNRRSSFVYYLKLIVPVVGQHTGAGWTVCTGCTNDAGTGHDGCKLIGCWKATELQYCAASVCSWPCRQVQASITSGHRLQGSI